MTTYERDIYRRPSTIIGQMEALRDLAGRLIYEMDVKPVRFFASTRHSQTFREAAGLSIGESLEVQGERLWFSKHFKEGGLQAESGGAVVTFAWARGGFAIASPETDQEILSWERITSSQARAAEELLVSHARVVMQ